MEAGSCVKKPAQLDAEIAVALKKPRRRTLKEVERLGSVREIFDGAAATLLDRFDLDGIDIPAVNYNDASRLLAAINFVADIVDPKDPDRVVQRFVAEYAALVDRGLAPPRRTFR